MVPSYLESNRRRLALFENTVQYFVCYQWRPPEVVMGSTNACATNFTWGLRCRAITLFDGLLL